MSRLFGTDGVRGVVNAFLTPELAYHLGRAAASYFGRQKKRPVFLIGRDTRISGAMLENALAAGICSVGGDVVVAGVVPTPAVAYLVRKHGWDAGVVISASHNKFPDNGIKFFDGQGFKLPDAVEDELEDLCQQSSENNVERPTGADIGRILNSRELAHEYAAFVESTVDVSLEGLTIVYDGANGAASAVGPEVFEKLGAKVIAINVDPDGVNINENAGSTHMEGLQAAVVKYGADVGIANDGDADRCLLVDEKGEALDGDQIMLLCAKQLKEQGRLKQDMIVGTVMSNIGFHKAAKELGMKTFSTAVGDRYVLEKMRAEGYSIGGEKSGQPLSELAKVMVKYPQLLVNVHVVTKTGWDENPLIKAEISEAARELGENGRILVRPSGTEALIRVMAEGPDHEQLERICHTVAETIGREQGLVEE